MEMVKNWRRRTSQLSTYICAKCSLVRLHRKTDTRVFQYAYRFHPFESLAIYLMPTFKRSICFNRPSSEEKAATAINRRYVSAESDGDGNNNTEPPNAYEANECERNGMSSSSSETAIARTTYERSKPVFETMKCFHKNNRNRLDTIVRVERKQSMVSVWS